MSEDLKILKEINQYAPVYKGEKEDIDILPVVEGEYVKKDELRAEAIKWVKHYTKIKADDSDKQIYTIQEHQELFINWIMHFFNIKESELK